MDEVGMSINLSELRQSFSSGRTRDAAWRTSQLQAIIRLLDENEDQIFQALQHDLEKHPIEVYRDEIGVVKKAATHALSCIDKWMASKNVRYHFNIVLELSSSIYPYGKKKTQELLLLQKKKDADIQRRQSQRIEEVRGTQKQICGSW